jgi:hypothetical protein
MDNGIPPSRVLAGATDMAPPARPDSGPSDDLDDLDDLGPSPLAIIVHLHTDYDSDKTRALLDEHGLHSRFAHEGGKAPVQARQRWHVERTHAWRNAFYQLNRCYERRAIVIDALLVPCRHDHHRA